VRHIRFSLLFLVFASLPATSAAAGDSGDGVGTDNPALLLPPFTGKCFDAQGEIAPCGPAADCMDGNAPQAPESCAAVADSARDDAVGGDPGGLPLDLGWSLSKGVKAEFSEGEAPRFVGALRSGLDLSLDGSDRRVAADAAGEMRYLGGQQGYFSSFDAGVLSEYDLTAATSLLFSGRFDASAPDPDDPDLPANTAETPVTAAWRAEAGVRQQLGRFGAELGVTGLRETVTDTVLDDASVIDNSEFGRTGWGAKARVGVDVTPGWGVFVAGAWRREVYDAASTDLGVKLDNSTLEARAGMSFEPDTTLAGEVSLGALRRGFDAGSLAPVTTYVAGADVQWSPIATATLTAHVSSDLKPTTEPGASTGISHEAKLEAAYDATDTLRLRSSVSAALDQYAGVAAQTSTTRVGVGVDYLVNRFTTMFADLTGTAIDDTTDGTSQSLAIEAGITVSR
jgi:hypothetical protein